MLFDLFSRMLNEPELRTFLAMFYPTLTSSLPGLTASPSHLVMETVTALERFGMIGPELFTDLIAFRPESHAQVTAAAAAILLAPDEHAANGQGLAPEGSDDASRPAVDPAVGSVPELVDELVKVFGQREGAAVLLARVGFPRSLNPALSNPLAYWTRVLEEIDHGAPPGSTASLAREASRLYPSNAVFGRHRG